MRSVKLSFVPNRNWIAIWLLALLVAVALLSVLIWGLLQEQPHRRAIALELQRIELSKTALQKVRELAAADAARGDPRAGSERMAKELLRRDWNLLYSIVESLNVPGARLVQLQMDGQSGQAQIEYELENLVEGSDVTAALNSMPSEVPKSDGLSFPQAASQNPKPVWQIQRLNTTASDLAGQGKVRGLWVGRLL